MNINSTNPATGQPIHSYQLLDSAELKRLIKLSHKSYLTWRKTSFSERADLMRRAGQVLRNKAGEYARLMADEMGKPIKAGRSEAEKCAWVCDYYAEHAAQFLQSEFIDTGATKSFVAFEPIGLVLAVMPWNFPFWQVFRFAAPALMAGNTGLLKHASNVPACSQAIENLFLEAGFPPHVFSNLLVDAKAVKTILKNPLVKAVTLTGSTGAGQAVAQTAGKYLKKSVMELGGSDPYIILEDANLDTAVQLCVSSRLINAGQSCIAAKRFIVVEPIREEFERRFVERMRTVKVGDPLDESTEMGPLARIDLRDELHQQVQTSITKGARCLLGGQIPNGPGAFYPPTVLTDVKKGMPAYKDELFGPIASIIPVKNERAAIKVANDTVFGLGAAVFTTNLKKGERIATKELEAGCCFVNEFVKSDPRLPFGGVKLSGYGRELSHYGIKEFVNIKTVYVK